MMSAPNYGLLRPIQQVNGMEPQDVLELSMKSREQDDAHRLSQIDAASKGIDVQNKALEQDFIPEKLQLEQDKLKSDLKTAQIAQQQEQQKKQFADVEMMNKYTGSVVHAPEKDKPIAYQNALEQAKKSGIDISGWPQEYDSNAAAMVGQGYYLSGAALEDYNAETKRKEADFKSPEMQTKLKVAQTKVENTLKEQEKVNAQASAAIKTINTLDNFEKSAEEMAMGTGRLAGKMQAFMGLPAAQRAEKWQNILALDLLSQQHFGRVTNKEMGIVQSSNPNIDMAPSARRQLVEQMRALALRDIEYQKYYATMVDKGVFDTGKIERLWNQYMLDNPVVDIETGKPNFANNLFFLSSLARSSASFFFAP